MCVYVCVNGWMDVYVVIVPSNRFIYSLKKSQKQLPARPPPRSPSSRISARPKTGPARASPPGRARGRCVCVVVVGMVGMIRSAGFFLQRQVREGAVWMWLLSLSKKRKTQKRRQRALTAGRRSHTPRRSRGRRSRPFPGPGWSAGSFPGSPPGGGGGA